MLPIASSILGTIPGWLTLGALIGGLVLVWRGGGGTALATLQTANTVLEKRVHELEKQGRADSETIAELKGKTDMALAVKPFMVWAETHELRAAERHDKTLLVLDLIAARIGPETS